MKRAHRRLAGVGMAALCAVSGAAAQAVHKCTVNGQTTYQATSCAGDDTVVRTAPAPSEQEVRAARVQAFTQRVEAATGRLYPRSPAPVRPPTGPKPKSNCDRLNEELASARQRLEAAQGRADLAARPDIARKAQADIDHVRGQAAASDCALSP
jgi:hypothetical protein